MLAGLLCAAGIACNNDYRYDRDICYRDNPDEYSAKMCRVDVAYRPHSKDRPVIVWFHGGGLTGGWRHIPEGLLTEDYVVIGVGYRFSPNVELGCIIDDAAAAVAWAFEHAAQYGGSASKIYLAGHSAGGYLVDMIGLEKKWLAAYGVDADSVAAVVPYSGQVITHFAHRATKGIDPLTPVVDEYAPLFHVRGDAAPFFVISGDREMELYGRYEETAYFVRMMRLRGAKDVRFVELPGYDHGAMAKPAHPLLIEYIKEREARADL